MQPESKHIPIPGPPTSLDVPSKTARRRRSPRVTKRDQLHEQALLPFMADGVPKLPPTNATKLVPLLLLLLLTMPTRAKAGAGVEDPIASAPARPAYLTEEAPLASEYVDVDVNVDVPFRDRQKRRPRRFHFKLRILERLRSIEEPRGDRRRRPRTEASQRKHSRATRRRADLEQVPPLEPRRRRPFRSKTRAPRHQSTSTPPIAGAAYNCLVSP